MPSASNGRISFKHFSTSPYNNELNQCVSNFSFITQNYRCISSHDLVRKLGSPIRHVRKHKHVYESSISTLHVNRLEHTYRTDSKCLNIGSITSETIYSI